MPRAWTRADILDLARSFQPACVLAAAADLDLFACMAGGPRTSSETAREIHGDPRATTILLDALAALQLVEKRGDRYSLPTDVAALLGGTGPGSVLAMAQHQANCLRRWTRLAHTVKAGRPRESAPSVRGESRDHEAFILAMNDLASVLADTLVRAVVPPEFRCLLDVGGASGTWTVAFLRACPSARAILFDLPAVIPLARKRFEGEGLSERVTLVPGDYVQDPLPAGADVAWVSAIVHQNSRSQNRDLFGKVHAALSPGGRIVIREMLMEPSRIEPVAGALFAVNMLVGTEEGGTYTVDELREDLESSGFVKVAVAHREPSMNSLLTALKS